MTFAYKIPIAELVIILNKEIKESRLNPKRIRQ